MSVGILVLYLQKLVVIFSSRMVPFIFDALLLLPSDSLFSLMFKSCKDTPKSKDTINFDYSKKKSL